MLQGLRSSGVWGGVVGGVLDESDGGADAVIVWIFEKELSADYTIREQDTNSALIAQMFPIYVRIRLRLYLSMFLNAARRKRGYVAAAIFREIEHGH